MQALSIDEMVQRLFEGDRRIAARLISIVENRVNGYQAAMKQIYPHTGNARILGVTGAGGAGKSTLADHLVKQFREQGSKVGVVVVDPSSPFSGGALLGDRIRLQNHMLDTGVFIRSMASRGYLGGLSRATYDVIRIIEAMGMDIIIVETLGAGQDEIDIIHIATTCLLVHTPNMGDDIQAMKAGIMEIADINVLNKADLEGAEICLRQLKSSINTVGFKEGEWEPKVLPTISLASKPEDIKGVDELMAAISEHYEYLQKTDAIARVKFERAEQELGLVFKDKLEKQIFDGLKGTGKKNAYISGILQGTNDPYSIVDEVFETFNHGK